ncbi:hypothetical protein [Caldimonas aquatica]|uniref:Uncharacterized protein n=1 Tax=Caldimonas aquatica TaxID=376175 RepID=A0ABY6MQT0_9BURK|nr:hypothetical protein [Schlegelella aquatica]UZD54368.1 hypothetical protein OMP39_11915 [Schlegelella aquatica]
MRSLGYVVVGALAGSLLLGLGLYLGAVAVEALGLGWFEPSREATLNRLVLWAWAVFAAGGAVWGLARALRARRASSVWR